MANNISLSPEEIKRAAKVGTTLLTTPGAVRVDGPLALSGDIQILNIILSNLATGLAILATPLPEKELPIGEDSDIPKGEGEDGDG